MGFEREQGGDEATRSVSELGYVRAFLEHGQIRKEWELCRTGMGVDGEHSEDAGESLAAHTKAPMPRIVGHRHVM